MNCRCYLNAYVRRGVIQKGPCEVCGTDKEIQAHHDDYSKPLKVRWLCRYHRLQLRGQLLPKGVTFEHVERSRKAASSRPAASLSLD
jgi:hypothetical protein